MSTTKIINGKQLKAAIREGADIGFNRQVDVGFIKNIDPEGFHVVSVALPFHNGLGQETPHHRCIVLVKVKQKDEAVELVFDIAESTYNTYTDADYVSAKINEATQREIKKALHVG